MATRGPPNQHKWNNITLRCLQINLKHSKSATDNLNQLTIEASIDIAFIQERYNYQNQVIRIPRNYKIFSSGKGRKGAAVIVINKKIDAIMIDQLSDDDTAVIEVTYGNLKFIATIICMDSKNEISSELH